MAITLRPLVEADADVMVDVLGAPSLYEYTGGEPPTLDQLRRRYAAQAMGGPADGSEEWWNHLVLVDGSPVGYVQATIPTGGDVAEIAWVIGERWQGRGIAGRATAVLVAELVGRGITRVVAHVHPEHVASIRVAKRLGMRPTDVIVDGEVEWVGEIGPSRT